MKTLLAFLILFQLPAFASKMCNLAMKTEATQGLGMRATDAAVAAEEFIERKAILGSVQMVSLLLASQRDRNSNFFERGREYYSAVHGSYVRADGSIPSQIRGAHDLKSTAESFKGINEIDRKHLEEFAQASIAALENLLAILEKPKIYRDAEFNKIRQNVMFSFESNNDILNTLLYIRDIKLNHPQKYEAFLKSWESSTPLVAEFALQAVKPKKSEGEHFWAWASIGAITTASIMMGQPVADLLGTPNSGGMMAFTGVGGFLGGFIGSYNASPPLKVIYYRTKALSAAVKRGLVKSKVKALLQKTLSLPSAEAQAAIAAESPKQSKLLDQAQDLSREGLKQILSESSHVDASKFEDLQKLSILNMRIMSAVSDQAVLLTERKESHQNRFDDLVSQLEKLDKVSEAEKRNAMVEANNLQLELSEIVLDGNSQHELITAFEKRIEVNLAILQLSPITMDVERVQSQLLLQQSVLRGMGQALTSSQNNLKAQLNLLNQMSIAIMLKRVK